MIFTFSMIRPHNTESARNDAESALFGSFTDNSMISTKSAVTDTRTDPLSGFAIDIDGNTNVLTDGIAEYGADGDDEDTRNGRHNP